MTVDVEAAQAWGNLRWFTRLYAADPTLVGVFVFMMRQAQGANNQALSFGKRGAAVHGQQADHHLRRRGGRRGGQAGACRGRRVPQVPGEVHRARRAHPKGVLLVGPPGTGKTLLSRAVAGEAGVPFFSISGSEFVEMFVGVGASRVRDLFDQAKRNAPCIVFVDEIDAVGRQRGAGLGGSHDEREQTLNQILVEMDGFDSQTNIIVIAATNRPDVLDPALLRPGPLRPPGRARPRPTSRAARRSCEVHARGKPLDKTVDAGDAGQADARLLGRRPGEPGQRGRHPGRPPQQEDHRHARDGRGDRPRHRRARAQEPHHLRARESDHRVPRGRPRRGRSHAAERTIRCTRSRIIARGMMGGYTRVLPAEDRYYVTKSQFKDRLAFALGGHAAEEVVFSEITTGAENDIERVTKSPARWSREYGMSEKLGPVALGHKEELVFLGREIGEQRNYSDEIAYEIDKEVRALVDEAYAPRQRNPDHLQGQADRDQRTADRERDPGCGRLRGFVRGYAKATAQLNLS